MSKLLPIKRPFAGSSTPKNEEVALEFLVRLCHDVLFEVLFFGDRRRLTKLERVSRRFHRMIENYFKIIPFLRLRLSFAIDPSNGTFVIGLDRENISRIELTTFPLFLRFDNIELFYCYSSASIEEKCAFIEKHLLPLKPALTDSNLVEISAIFSKNDHSVFNDHLQLLEYLRNELFPICNSSRGYKFDIWFGSAEISATSLITSLLQMPEIKRCSSLEIRMHLRGHDKLPIDEISNWLEINVDGMGNDVQNPKKRSLRLSLFPGIQTKNAQEMFEHLKTKFIRAKFCLRPFTFRFWKCDTKELEIKAKTLTNGETDEEFSVDVVYDEIRIKRARKKTKKDEIKIKRARKETKRNC